MTAAAQSPKAGLAGFELESPASRIVDHITDRSIKTSRTRKGSCQAASSFCSFAPVESLLVGNGGEG